MNLMSEDVQYRGDCAGEEERNCDDNQPVSVDPAIGDTDGRDDQAKFTEVGQVQ